MKTFIIALLLVAPQALAAPPIRDASAPVVVLAPPAKVVVVECDRATWPSRRAVKDYLDAHSRDETQHAWQAMRRELDALCARGQSGARVAFYPAATDGRSQAYVARSDGAIEPTEALAKK